MDFSEGRLSPDFLARDLDASAITDRDCRNQFRLIEGDAALEFIAGDWLDQLGGHAQQYATVQVQNVLKRYRHIEQGGWAFQGLDPQNGFHTMGWGCFKSITPRIDPAKGKPIKYEHPAKTPTRIFVPGTRDRWLERDPSEPVYVTEGAKKAAALYSAGKLAIGLAGIWNHATAAGEGRALHPDLEALCSAEGNWIIALDQDVKPKTRKAVQAATNRLGWLLKGQEQGVSVLEWQPELGKGIDDVLATHGPEAITRLAPKPFREWSLGFRVDRMMKRLTERRVKADETYSERYCRPLDLEQHSHTALIAPKGSGKTHSAVMEGKRLINQGEQVIVLGHRVALLRKTCAQLGLEVGAEDQCNSAGFGVCIDSLWKLRPERLRNTTIIIDEICQLLSSLLSGKTEVKKRRITIIKVFSAILKGARRVLIMDADLDTKTREYIESILGIRFHVIENEASDNPSWEVISYDSPQALLAKIIEDIRQGKRVAIACDSQRNKAPFGTQVIEAHIADKCPKTHTLRTDADSLTDPDHEAFRSVEVLNEILPRYSVFIYSPSLNTGVSIDLHDHFDAVYVFATGGHLTENSVRQLMARVREPVPRHIFIAERGQQIFGGESSAEAIQNSQEAKTKALRNRYANSFIDSNLSVDSSHLKMWADGVTLQNAIAPIYRPLIEAQLRAEGHSITHNTDGPLSGDGDTRETREILYESHCHSVEHAAPRTDSEIKDLEQRQELTKPERLSLRKARLERAYGIHATAELVKADDKGLYPRLKLLYLLLDGRDTVEDRDRAVIAEGEKNGGWFGPDLTSRTHVTKVIALERLEVPKLIEDRERLYRPSDRDVMALYLTVMANRDQFKAIFGISVPSKATAMRVLSIVLKLIGIKLFCVCKEGGRGEQVRVCRAIRPDFETEVFEAWRSRDDAAKATVGTALYMGGE